MESIANGICELLWLVGLFIDLGFSIQDLMNLYCDKKTAIRIAHNLMQHDKTKHVEVHHHFIKDHLQLGHICTPFVRTNNQLADIFTKGLSSTHFLSIISNLGMQDLYSPT